LKLPDHIIQFSIASVAEASYGIARTEATFCINVQEALANAPSILASKISFIIC